MSQPSAHLQVLKGTKVERLQQLYSQWYGCSKCSMLVNARIDVEGKPIPDIVFGEGDPDAKIMIIGEAPGEEEAAINAPFVGASGRLLNQMLAANSEDTGIQELFRWYNARRHSRNDSEDFHSKVLLWRQKEFFITNVVACRPPDNRAPTNPEVAACLERLHNLIYIVDPWMIITLGRIPIQSLLKKQVEITKDRGTIYDIQFSGLVSPYTIPVMATMHPSYLLRTADFKSKKGMFLKTVRDIRNALEYVDHLKFRNLGIPVPYRPELP